MTKRPARETARTAFEARKAEALRRLALIQAAIENEGKGEIHWGHVGSMQEVVDNLGNAGHWAGVAELTEK